METTRSVVDLGIIGGGPAGSVAALETVRRGLRVILWERGRFPRDKVCGEFLSPECIPLLSRIIPGALRRAAAIHQAEFYSRKGRRFSIQLPRPACGLSRRVLDEALWQAAQEAGADCRQGEAVDSVRQRAGPDSLDWEVSTAPDGVQRVRRLVIACGRWWRIAGMRSPAPLGGMNTRLAGEWMGAKAHFAGVSLRDSVEMYFFPGGYCGLAPIEGGLYNACCLVHRNLARSQRGAELADLGAWLNKIGRHPALEARLRGAAQVSSTVTTAPVRTARGRAESGGAFFAGDAAGFIDPFTGDGISMALHSGRLAAEELEIIESAKEHNHADSPGYRRRLARSVSRSYLLAALLRGLVRAPAELQDWVTLMMPACAGSRLLRATRWRATCSAGL